MLVVPYVYSSSETMRSNSTSRINSNNNTMYTSVDTQMNRENELDGTNTNTQERRLGNCNHHDDDRAIIDIEENDASTPFDDDFDDSSNSGHDNSNNNNNINNNNNRRQKYQPLTTTTSTTTGTRSNSSSSNNNNSNIPRHGWLLIITLLFALMISFLYIYIIQNTSHSITTTPGTPTITPSSSTTGTTTGSTTTTTTIAYDPSVMNVEWNPFQINFTSSSSSSMHQQSAYDTLDGDYTSSIISPTLHLVYQNNNDNDIPNQDSSMMTLFGYMMQPNIVQNQIVFVSLGDLYITTLPSSDYNHMNNNNNNKNNNNTKMTAIRLTYTIGNVRNPKINPIYPYLIAYTATYQARRDVYILDLRRISSSSSSSPSSSGSSSGNVPAQRLTYVDSPNGITTLVGWSHNGTVLTYGTTSIQVGLRDLRLYDIAIAYQPSSSSVVLPSHPSSQLQVLEIRPVPLSQATDGVRISKDIATTEEEDCIIFVRYKQGSHTSRYVGGTTEQLWLYCQNQQYAIPLTNDYTGTSKQPTIYYYSTTTTKQRFLFFISDRTYMTTTKPVVGPKVFHSPNQQWRATTMNLWAVALPNNLIDLYTIYQTAMSKSTTMNDRPSTVTIFPPETMIQLTHISCQFNGMSLQEYTIDTMNGSPGGIVVRIGADLYHLSSDMINDTLLNRGSSSTNTGMRNKPGLLPIQVLSDYYEQQERIISIDSPQNYGRLDVFTTPYGSTSLLMTIRGQVWVAPVLTDISMNDVVPYQGSAGYNIPPRRYRVIPGSMTGGAIRVLAALYIPLYTDAAASSNTTTTTTDTIQNPNRRLSLVLATDPRSPTAEHAFYIVEIQSDLINQFNDLNHWPVPFLGGHVNGGSTKDGGLGSVRESSIKISSCGRRFAWTDTDNRICVMTMPIYKKDGDNYTFHCLPATNDQGEPLSGTLSVMKWSPGGRYLGIEHNALNEFSIISIVDCGNPEVERGDTVADITLGSAIQVTPSRFNSYAFTWGKSSFDIFWSSFVTTLGHPPPADALTTLYFVSDRDVVTDVKSPWGSRAPLPHFPSTEGHIYALPLPVKTAANVPEPLNAQYPGGGIAELFYDDLNTYTKGINEQTITKQNQSNRMLHESLMTNLSRMLKGRKLREDETMIIARYLQDQMMSDTNETTTAPSSPFPQDADLDLPLMFNNMTLARKAYRIPRINKGKYVSTSQTLDDGSLILIERDEVKDYRLKYFSANPFPSDVLDSYTVPGVYNYEESTSGNHLCMIASSGETSVIRKTGSGVLGFIGDADWVRNQADVSGISISVWPNLEYRQMYNDAWRLMRDYFYDSNMHNVNWTDVHTRYLPLVQRCGKREELDDVLGQMASETSALHSFVYGGEYNSPDPPSLEPASLGAFFKRAPEWKGYMIQEIPHRDPDFDLVDGDAVYCPISDQSLRPTGQRGLAVGDVIVAVNGESVMTVPDINMMLRGTSGRSIRLEVLRLSSGKMNTPNATIANTESLVVVPISTDSADTLRYNAWEWKTRGLAKELANNSGFSVGYIHMQAMNSDGEDAFARGYYPDFDKDALILDVRHNMGGNIDSWILSTLQRKAFMYWAPRSGDTRYGELDWDEQFAFRGKVIVLIDELTASNGEGVARGISELGLGKLVGTRTWGGGIWGSSANKLVDGGIAAAPQWGIFNDKFGWGGGIEMTGVEPDIVVDNDPFMTFNGRDMQLERAIVELSAWLKSDPILAYKTPDGGRPDMSLHDDCSV